MDIRRNFFMMWMARHWNRLSRKIVGVPPLEWFKVQWGFEDLDLVTDVPDRKDWN